MGLAAAPVAFALTSGLVSSPLAATNSSFGLAQPASAPTKDQRDDRDTAGGPAAGTTQDPTSAAAAADPAAGTRVVPAADAAPAGRQETVATRPPRVRTVTVTVPERPAAPTTSTTPDDNTGTGAPPADVPTSTGTSAHEPHEGSEPPEGTEPPEHESDG